MATENSIDPPGYGDDEDDVFAEENPSSGGTTSGRSSEKGMLANIRRKIRKRQRAKLRQAMTVEPGRRRFKIPATQYTSLDEKVAERTMELEISKKAAEAANESKTLFIANISHELKNRIKQSLKTVYKSGDLLLHLLEDLLSFSKNQIGQQVSLEEGEFRLGDVRSQVLAIFDKQVRESKSGLTVTFVSDPPVRTADPARTSDSRLWVLRALKFTPPGGTVSLRIRCVGEVEQPSDGSRTSSLSKTGSSNRAGRTRHRVVSGSTNSASSKGPHLPVSSVNGGTALAINPADPKATPQIHIRERSSTPPPPNAKTYLFEFEYGGTGLGLSICSRLATLTGGHISLKSTPGVRTAFTIQIPLKYVKDRASSTASSSMKSRPPSVGSMEGDLRSLAQRNSTEAQRQPVAALVLDQQPRLVGLSQPFFASTPNRISKEDQMAAIDRDMATKSGQGKFRVLVADDNSTNIEVVSRLLKLEGVYDLFDVIFMDVQMPNPDGLQSTRLIRRMGYSAAIVTLAAFSEESNVRECMESVMNEFLSKPIRRPALKKVLAKFATIPEEPETSSLTRKTRPGKTPVATPELEVKDPLANGTGISASVPPTEVQ
ncbi:hypothetical protein L209DRAFT_738888 [Thermothelomyces heterothallicus CBS 203.75]